MPPHKRIFTPTTIEIIRGLANQGKSAAEIADAIGSTPASVRVKCCQLKIKISRRGRPDLSPSRQPPGHERTLLLIPMQSETYAALKQKAAQKHKAPVEFAEMLLEAIVNSDLYDAIFDDRE